MLCFFDVLDLSFHEFTSPDVLSRCPAIAGRTYFSAEVFGIPSWFHCLLEVAMSKTVTVQLSADEQAQMQRVAKERGYLSPTAFIRAATEPLSRGLLALFFNLLPP